MSKKNHSNDKVAFMIGQMANFKCKEGHYSTIYSPSYNKPKTWWQMVDDPNEYLKSLALKLFSITPHSTACERAFSALEFLYGKKRHCLNLSTIEMMAKIRYYLLSNVKGELNHFIVEESEAELKNLIIECGLFDDDDVDNMDDENNDFLEESLEIPSHEVQVLNVLIVNDLVDMSNSIFTGEFEGEIYDNDNNNSSDNENDEYLEEEQELDFEIIAKISAPPNM